MATISREVLSAFDALEKADKELAEVKEDLKKVMDDRAYVLKVFENDHSTKRAEQVVENDSNYIYLMNRYAKAYYSSLNAHRLVCHALKADRKYENQINQSRDLVGESEKTLNSISYEYDDTKENLLTSDPDNGKFSKVEDEKEDIYKPLVRKNGSGFWAARETDIAHAENAFGRVIEQEKKNNEFFKNLDKEFDKFVAENYPMLKRQPGSLEE